MQSTNPSTSPTMRTGAFVCRRDPANENQRVTYRALINVIEQHPGVGSVRLVRPKTPKASLTAYITPHPITANAVAQLLASTENGLMAGYRPYVLPDGTMIVHQNKGETDFVYKEIFEENCYIRHGITLQDGDYVFDVGANIGMFPLYLNTRPYTLNVFSFEPLPPLHDLLEINRIVCGLQNVRSFSYGLSRQAGTETFTYYPRNSDMSGRFADVAEDSDVVKTYLFRRIQAAHVPSMPREVRYEGANKNSVVAEQFECQLKTLSDVIAEQDIKRIDLLKIDVENNELDVLLGIREDDWKKIRQLVAEVYDGDNRLAVIRQLLIRQGFEVITEQDECLRDTRVHMLYAKRPGSIPIRAENVSRFHKAPPSWRNSPTLLADDVRRHIAEYLPDLGQFPELRVVNALPE